jgi:hypothetical protein
MTRRGSSVRHRSGRWRRVIVAAVGLLAVGFPAAAEAAAPAPGTCWVVTRIVVHYHVGIRHYSASDPYQLAVCANADQVKAAMNDAEAAG